jgi:hypothetical protein
MDFAFFFFFFSSYFPRSFVEGGGFLRRDSLRGLLRTESWKDSYVSTEHSKPYDADRHSGKYMYRRLWSDCLRIPVRYLCRYSGGEYLCISVYSAGWSEGDVVATYQLFNLTL